MNHCLQNKGMNLEEFLVSQDVILITLLIID